MFDRRQGDTEALGSEVGAECVREHGAMLPTRKVRTGSGGLPGISPPLTVLLVVSFLTIFTLGRWSAHYGSKVEKFGTAQSESFDVLARPDTKAGRTLITYIFSDTDAEYANNLKFFVRWGVRENDNADYIFVLQLADRHRVRADNSRKGLKRVGAEHN